jgi:hypothetical protein
MEIKHQMQVNARGPLKPMPKYPPRNQNAVAVVMINPHHRHGHSFYVFPLAREGGTPVPEWRAQGAVFGT